MKAFSKIVSFLLVITLLVNSAPLQIFANEEIPQMNSLIEGSELAYEGNNSIGNMFVNTLAENQSLKEQDYYVSNVVVEGNYATVTYAAQEDCNLIVGVYSEDEIEMLAVGSTDINFCEQQVVVKLEGEIPEYFTAKAYLLNEVNNHRLSDTYTTTQYTKEFQDFLQTTVEDFDEEYVINLDDDDTTNFAVLGEEVIIIEQEENKNIVELADYENGIYIISAANSTVLSLKQNDYFSYQYSEEDVLVGQVSDIGISGDTVTITTADISLEDVFDFVKIDSESMIDEAEFDHSRLDDGLTFMGFEEETNAARQSRWEGSKKVTAQFDISKDFIDKEIKVTVSGKIKFGVKANVKLYIYWDKQFFESTLETTGEFSGSVSGAVKLSLALSDIIIPIIPGVTSCHIKVDFLLEPKLELEITIGTESTIGFAYDSKSGFINKTTRPKPTFNIELEGSVFIGFEIEANIGLVEGALAKAYIKSKIGFEATGKYGTDEKEGERHECNWCVGGEINGVVQTSAGVKLLNSSKFDFKSELVNKLSIKLSDFYFSRDLQAFGFTTCPNKSYRTTITIVDQNGNPVEGANVYIEDLSMTVSTNAKGAAEQYLKNNKYNIEIAKEGERLSQKIKINGKPKSLRILFDTNIIAGGYFGLDNLRWALNQNGHLMISGNGRMYLGWDNNDDWPWIPYKELIRKITIENGVTRVGERAFAEFPNLLAVSLPENTLTYIGSSAFEKCESLNDIVLPQSLNVLSGSVFRGCTSLTKLDIPEKVPALPRELFYGCTNLQEVNLSEGLEQIHSYVFCHTAITSIELPDSLTVLDSEAFKDCLDLESVRLSPNLEALGSKGLRYGQVFQNCSSLKSIEIPEGITQIYDRTFSGCSSLEKVILPKSLTSIAYDAFKQCSSLTEINLPDSVTKIEASAFYGCEKLTVDMPSELEYLGHEAFYDCKLESVIFPVCLKNIGIRAIYNSSLKRIIYKGDLPSWDAIGGYQYLCINNGLVIYYPAGNSTWDEAVEYYGRDSRDGYNLQAYSSVDNFINTRYLNTKPIESVQTEPSEGFVLGNNSDSNDTESLNWTDSKSETQPTLSFNTNTDPIQTNTQELQYTDGIVQTAEFNGLEPGELYVILIVNSEKKSDLINAENLLYVNESTADLSGSISLQYIPRFSVEEPITIAIGGTLTDISGGSISIPSMKYNGQEQSPEIMISYEGKILTEYQDYILSGDTSAKNAGTYFIMVTGVGDYTGSLKSTYVIERIEASITVESTFNKTVGDDAFWLAAYIIEGTPKFTSSNTSVATVDGNGYVTIKGSGTSVITVTVEQTQNYYSVTKNITINVSKKSQVISGTTQYFKKYGDSAFTLDTKLTTGNGALSYLSSNTGVATVDRSGKVTIMGSGTAKITITAAETVNYHTAAKTITVTVGKAYQKISAKSFTKTYGNKAFSLGAKCTSGNGKLTYKSSNTKVAAVSSVGKVAIKNPGKATITITATETSNYTKATKNVTIIVKPKKLSAPTAKNSTKKKATVKWKKDTKVTGYQIQYSTSSRFISNNKTKSITKHTTVKKTLTGLKSGKTYFVRVRSYKTVSGKKIYGAWSAKAKVKVK